jgi:alpha-galactosidase
MKTKAFIIILFTSTTIFSQKFEGLAKTPPMGWNSWNKFACQVDEKLIRETADAMVSSGMKDAGYQYINIDDCWQGKRDSLGFIHPDPERFPSGMKNLADYIHSKGLKFGIYSDAGWKTCGGRAGSRGYEFQDAMTYARWGVDYLKYDWCNTEGLNAEGAYLTMREALYSAGRPIVFSICEWGGNKPWDWGTGDISNCFDCIVDHGSWKSWGVMQILDMQEGLRVHAGPDHWNDPDMMEVGNGMTNNEDRAHFSMWCMLSAPLIAGNDLRNMSESVTNILTNKKVIAVNQDKLGIQAFKHSAEDSLEVWYKPLSDNEWAVCFLNRSTTPKSFEYIWKQKQIEDNFSSRELNVKDIEYNILDLWINNNLGTTNNNLSYEIPAHDVLMVRLIPIP